MTTKKETAPASKADNAKRPQMPLGKTNFSLMAVCVLMIVIGFVLMTGSANTGSTFNADIFNPRRTVVAPLITFAGFVLLAFAIIVKPKKKDNSEEDL